MKQFIDKIVAGSLITIILSACSPTQYSTVVEAKDGEILSIKGQRKISGIYPHLTTYSHGRLNGNYGLGSECGIGAIAVWQDKLYMVNYAAHQPKGSEHKLYIVDKDKKMTVFQGSIGGTPAARMIHKESNQLLIGPYVIDFKGNIRVIPIKDMQGRLTAIARHLKAPENKVYYYDMEGALYEVNVYTLEVKKLFSDPLPGWHGKGGYTSQGKLILANNGEHNNEPTKDWQIDNTDMIGKEKNGILAEYDGEKFKVIERRQYTDVTTKNGINALPNEESPLWSMGWDKRAVRLQVMDNKKWTTYLIPKATYNNDPSHGWFTEWPRIREIGSKDMMMDMHGMFYNFPHTFSASKTAGISPIGSHLRYIPDFLSWNKKIVLATDETSIQGNPLAGQPQSNLWFGKKKDLSKWGPATAYGAIWLEDDVAKNEPSLPFLISGFDHVALHLVNNSNSPTNITIQIDANGKNEWSNLKSIPIAANGYAFYIFNKSIKAEWVRLISDTSNNLSATLHLTDSRPNKVKCKNIFSDIADIDSNETVLHSKLYSNKTNFNLTVFSGKIANATFTRDNDYELTNFNFEFKKGLKDSAALEALKTENIWKELDFANKEIADKSNAEMANKAIWTEDEASVILHAKNYNLRLPKGSIKHKTNFPAGTMRFKREVESERELANICGTFYELPLQEVGKEPLYKMMRPIATHNKQISDFNTWNGLLVMSGITKTAKASKHIYKSNDGNTALWFGGIDDIWSFGKPHGEGGPWKNSAVKANELSEPYLMTGYDKKSVSLEADASVEISIYVHINPYLKKPVLFKTFAIKAGEKINYEFPEGFSAHWVQLKTDKNCKATAWFVYQ